MIDNNQPFKQVVFKGGIQIVNYVCHKNLQLKRLKIEGTELSTTEPIGNTKLRNGLPIASYVGIH